MSYYNKNRQALVERSQLQGGVEDFSFERLLTENYDVYTDEEIDQLVEELINSEGNIIPPVDPKIAPLGSNTDESRNLYFRRKFYKDYAWPSKKEELIIPETVGNYTQLRGVNADKFEDIKYIDLMYEKAFYGRIDTNNRSIYPSEKFLKLCKNTENVFLLNFVNEALTDMMEKIEGMKESGKLSPQSSYFNFVPQKGWTKFLDDHHSTMKAIYDGFIVKYINDPQLFKRVTSYDTFSRELILFLQRFLPRFPITRTNMLLRNATDPLISGLIFEIAKDGHDEDKKKYLDYIQDPHFVQIQNIANGFGFMVDRNAPWRFVADLESPQMKRRMAEKGFSTVQEMFDAYYYHAHLYEVDSIKTYFLSFYDSFVEAFPYYTVVEKCGDGSKAKLFNRERRQKDPFTDKKLLELYYFIRVREAMLDWNQTYFNNELEAAYKIFQKFGFESALDYVNDKTTQIVGFGANYGNKVKLEEGERIIQNHDPSYRTSKINIIV